MHQIRRALLLGLLVATMAHAAELGVPQLTSSGSIRCGDKELRLASGHFTYTADGRKMMDIYPCWSWQVGGYGESGYGDAEGRTEFDAASRTTVYRAVIKGRTEERNQASYASSLTLGGDGIVRCRIAFTALGELAGKPLVQVRFPGTTLEGTVIEAGAGPLTVAPSPGKRSNIDLGAGSEVAFFATEPDRLVRILLDRHDASKPRGISDGRLDSSLPRMEYRIFLDHENVAEFRLDIRAISEAKKAAVAARRVDEFDAYEYARHNQVELPNYRASRNLIQNPSFEEGWHGFWQLGNANTRDADYLREGISIDATTAWHGSRSLRFQFRPDRGTRPGNVDNFVGLVAPYAFQFKKGVRYTFSCYAKSEQEGLALSAVVVSKDWGQWMKGSPSFPLTREWKRYSAAFTPSGDIGQFYLGVPWWDLKTLQAVKDPKVHIWVDAIQFEEGPGTDFTLKPLAFSLDRTRKVLSILDPKTLAIDCLNSTGRELKADLEVAVLDGFKNRVHVQALPGVTVPANGTLPLEVKVPRAMDYIGRYTVRIGVVGADGSSDHDAYALTVIEPFSAERFAATRNLRMFGFTGLPAGDLARNMRLCRELGFGAMQTGGMLPIGEEPFAVAAKEGVLVSTGIFGDNWSTTVDPRFPAFHNMLKAASLDGPDIQGIYDFLPGFFKEYRHHRYWKYLNEPASGGHAGAVCQPADNVAFMARIHPIIRREIPDAVIISSDPANNYDAGRKWLDGVLSAGGGKYFDVLAIHPYREKPERPSLERDTEEFIALADRHGFKGPLWYTEGGYFPLLNIPGLGVGPTGMCSTDNMRLTGFTEDGMGDRRGLAYHLRTILICLRYADRIGMFLNHHIGLAIDAARQMPSELGVGYNALANRLGNARFTKNFTYADGVRAYLFDDGAGGGVVALWDCDDVLERGERAPYRFVLADSAAAVTDTFGRPLALARRGAEVEFAVDYMPLFISSPDLAALTAAMGRSRLVFGATEAVVIDLRPADAQHLLLTLKNRHSEAFAGRLDYAVNGKPGSAPLAIPALGETTLNLPLAGIVDSASARQTLDFSAGLFDAKSAKIRDFQVHLNVLVCRRGATASAGPGARVGFDRADIIEHTAASWRGPDDLSATVRLGWDEDGLHLQARVTDDRFVPAANVQAAWAYDSLQVFIDAFKNATPTALNMDDDYAYMVAKTPLGDEVYRNQTPSRQIAWLDNGVVEKGVSATIVRDEAAKTTLYTVDFPRKYLVPVALKQGGVIGLGVMVNDADDPAAKRKAALTTANGQEAWQKPYNLSFVVFE